MRSAIGGGGLLLLLLAGLSGGAQAQGTGQGTRQGGAGGDALPLRRGFYLPEGTPCARASNAELLLYTGRGFNVAQAECRITRLRRQGEAFDITETCQDLRGGDRMTGQSRILVSGPDAYAMVSGGTTQRYRYCPQAQLPAPWRSNRIP